MDRICFPSYKIKNAFRPGSILEHPGKQKVNQFLSYNQFRRVVAKIKNLKLFHTSE